jgi:hypothetical protein
MRAWIIVIGVSAGVVPIGFDSSQAAPQADPVASDTPPGSAASDSTRSDRSASEADGPTEPDDPAAPDGDGERDITEPAQSDPSPGPREPRGLSDQLGVAPEIFTARLYGYIDSHYEKSAPTPVEVDAQNQTVMGDNPAEFDVVNFNLMLQGKVYGRYRYFINFASPGSGSPTGDEGINIRNAWVEFPVYRDFFDFRIGKTYRRFGLYNEILDAIPTFIGIEPPEMFDKDHLMLTRTTNAMLHGTIDSGEAAFSYALSTGNDERSSSQVPFGVDLRFDLASTLKVGGSYYSSNGSAVPTTEVGDGAPVGGVASWMAEDRFQVYAVFAQLTRSGLTLQAEYTGASHDAERDPARVMALLDADPPLRDPQRQRFGLDGMVPGEGDVNIQADYQVRAAYGRAGYEFEAGGWSFIPYGQFDYYSNPESIASKDFGGDNEAGLADDGIFYKSTLGLVARPTRFVAVKIDGSTHTQKFNGETITYPEIRTSFSLYWELGNAE